jgi:hypothetical protein
MQRDVNQRELARIALKCNTGKPPRRLLEQAVLIAAAVTPDSLSEPPSGAANGGGIHFFGAEQLDEAGLAKLRAILPIAAVDIGMPPFVGISRDKRRSSLTNSQSKCVPRCRR